MKQVSFYTTAGIGPGQRSFYVICESKERMERVQHKALTEGYRYHGTVQVEDDLKEIKAESFLQKGWQI